MVQRTGRDCCQKSRRLLSVSSFWVLVSYEFVFWRESMWKVLIGWVSWSMLRVGSPIKNCNTDMILKKCISNLINYFFLNMFVELELPFCILIMQCCFMYCFYCSKYNTPDFSYFNCNCHIHWELPKRFLSASVSSGLQIWAHSPGLPTAFGWGACGGWFGCTGLHTGLLVGHGQHLPLLLGQFSRNRGVLNAGVDTAGRRKNIC